jgi:type III secretion protein Q
MADRTGASETEGADFDELPVRLVFEVGRSDFTLGELRQLAPGMVVPLARPLSEALDVVANGKRIGSGTLIKIGDSIGVRITRILDLG